jgi:hypothetical protein
MTYTATKTDSIPIPVQPAWLSCYVLNSASETNVPIYIPWRNCRLAHAYTVVVGVVDGDGAMEIDLELNAAAGTEMMTITVAASAAVGDIDEATVSTQSACENLSRDNADRDAVNIEVDGSTTGTGGVMLHMFFESNS